MGGALQEGSSLEVSASGAVEQTNYPLSLVAGPGERLALKLLYDPARYAPQTAERLLGHLRTLLEGMAAAQEGRLGDLPLLPPAERRQVVVDWNATASLYPRDATVHQLVAAQAARAPQAVAVVDGGATLTYGDLEAQANRLAQHLLALGIDPEDRVGVCLGRSAGAVVALLAVLKAGAVYVPLDPAYPPARLAAMLEDAGARVVLTAGEAAAGLLSGEAGLVRLVRLDDPLEALAIAARPDTPPRVAVAPEGLAYVVYTSGSTGRPKGVAVTHRAINRLVCNTDYITLTPADRMAHASNLSFDAATFELWGALIHGARLVVVDPATALSPRTWWPSSGGSRSGSCSSPQPSSTSSRRPLRTPSPPCATSASGGRPPTPAPPRRCSARAPRKPCSTSTAPPSAPPSPPGTSWKSPRRRRTISPSGAPSPTPRPTSWTPAGSPFPPASPASCTWEATGWRGATWGAPG